MYMEYIHEKKLKEFEDLISKSLNHTEQERKLIALYQYSGAGKTKLCYSISQRRPCVIIRKCVFFSIIFILNTYLHSLLEFL